MEMGEMSYEHREERIGGAQAKINHPAQMRAFCDDGDGGIPLLDELTDEQWRLVAPLVLPEEKRGRPPASTRRVLDGVLHTIRHALTWAEVPPEYPSYATLFRRYHEWCESGTLQEVINTLRDHLSERSGLEYGQAVREKRIRYEQTGETLTFRLPAEYGRYWMQPTAVLILMWIVTRALEVYRQRYRLQCQQAGVSRVPGQAGPRKSRPREVVWEVEVP
jgi:transposase